MADHGNVIELQTVPEIETHDLGFDPRALPAIHRVPSETSTPKSSPVENATEEGSYRLMDLSLYFKDSAVERAYQLGPVSYQEESDKRMLRWFVGGAWVFAFAVTTMTLTGWDPKRKWDTALLLSFGLFNGQALTATLGLLRLHQVDHHVGTQWLATFILMQGQVVICSFNAIRYNRLAVESPETEQCMWTRELFHSQLLLLVLGATVVRLNLISPNHHHTAVQVLCAEVVAILDSFLMPYLLQVPCTNTVAFQTTKVFFFAFCLATVWVSSWRSERLNRRNFALQHQLGKDLNEARATSAMLHNMYTRLEGHWTGGRLRYRSCGGSTSQMQELSVVESPDGLEACYSEQGNHSTAMRGRQSFARGTAKQGVWAQQASQAQTVASYSEPYPGDRSAHRVGNIAEAETEDAGGAGLGSCTSLVPAGSCHCTSGNNGTHGSGGGTNGTGSSAGTPSTSSSANSSTGNSTRKQDKGVTQGRNRRQHSQLSRSSGDFACHNTTCHNAASNEGGTTGVAESSSIQLAQGTQAAQVQPVVGTSNASGAASEVSEAGEGKEASAAATTVEINKASQKHPPPKSPYWDSLRVAHAKSSELNRAEIARRGHRQGSLYGGMPAPRGQLSMERDGTSQKVEGKRAVVDRGQRDLSDLKYDA